MATDPSADDDGPVQQGGGTAEGAETLDPAEEADGGRMDERPRKGITYLILPKDDPQAVIDAARAQARSQGTQLPTRPTTDPDE